jgi:hypothetical protein
VFMMVVLFSFYFLLPDMTISNMAAHLCILLEEYVLNVSPSFQVSEQVLSDGIICYVSIRSW